ncbi:DUF6461 domain-containing protein [Streptomyces virginiae]|uniref:DUF6461 domain-containing protein n=1 Tax=Streptomyces virginiae TaxID=1961 RepID=UPI0035E2E994
MPQVGLDPSGDEDPDVGTKAAVLALTERLTGVRLTEELLTTAEYHVGAVPEEPVRHTEHRPPSTGSVTRP